jgi:hypothetical protein
VGERKVSEFGARSAENFTESGVATRPSTPSLIILLEMANSVDQDCILR